MKVKILNILTSVFVAIAINGLIFWSISSTGSLTITEQERQTELVMIIPVEKKESDMDIMDPLPEKPILEPEVATVNLDFSAANHVTLEPIQSQLDIPVPGAISIRIPKESPLAQKNQNPESDPSMCDIVNFAENVDHPPVEINQLYPQYPALAIRDALEGTVTIKILVGKDGIVEEYHILNSTGPEIFRMVVLSDLENWRFRPASHHGQTVRVWAVKTINFTLE